MNDLPVKDQILTFLQFKARKPVNIYAIGQYLSLIKPHEVRLLRKTLTELAKAGFVVRLTGNRFALPSNLRLVVGVYYPTRGKGGTVVPDKANEPEVYVSPGSTFGALPKDRVVVRVENKLPKGDYTGSIVRILDRGLKHIVGIYHIKSKVSYVEVIGVKEPFDVIIEEPPKYEIPLHSLVKTRLTTYPKGGFLATGVVVKVIGPKDALRPHIEAILINSGISKDYPENTLREIQMLPYKTVKIKEDKEVEQRKELRSLNFITIDGENAKDFDDAVCLVENEDGSKVLYVAIADVSHYVTSDSALDIEARRRGTSVYYSNSVVPMLPLELSWDLCSLNPGKDRLVMVVEMRFSKRFRLISHELYEGSINSKARLTYKNVNEYLRRSINRLQGDETLGNMVRGMAKLASIMHEKRSKHGSLDFDLPEALVILSEEGGIDGIVRGVRGEAERIIEEFMIATNVVVATYMFKEKYPAMYRIHEPPDISKLKSYAEFSNRRGLDFNVELKKNITPKMLSLYLGSIKGRKDEQILHYMLLRSLKRAKYDPKCKGHFGLALGAYTHFTSPIRRYPDLFVHRSLKKGLLEKRQPEKSPTSKRSFSEDELLDLTHQCSNTEKAADEIERAILDLYKVFYIKNHVGEVFEGYICSVTSFGFFVELDDIFLEGLVHISSIGDDYYVFNESLGSLVGRHTNRSFNLGDRVMVQVARVNLEERTIDFLLYNDNKAQELSSYKKLLKKASRRKKSLNGKKAS